jgi:hypothetical protein
MGTTPSMPIQALGTIKPPKKPGRLAKISTLKPRY